MIPPKESARSTIKQSAPAKTNVHNLSGTPSEVNTGQSELIAKPCILSIVANAKATATRDVDAAQIILAIRSGKWREPVEIIRAEFSRVLTLTGNLKDAKGAISPLKKGLPGVMPSGQFSSRTKPAATKLLAHSGLLCGDLDDLGERFAEARAKLAVSPHLWTMFTSPNGNGLKCWFRILADEARHADSFRAVQQHVRELTAEEIDESCCDVARLCFVSFDPDALVNAKAVELLPRAHTPICLTPASASFVSASLPDCVPASAASLYNNAPVILENIVTRNEAQRALEAGQPQLAKLYTAMIEDRFMALPHGRNAFLTKAIPFLYRAVAERLILKLVGHFYDCNRALFADGREQHMQEAKAMLQSVVKTYTDSLRADEIAIYQALITDEQEAFRICRDLASLTSHEREPGTFFLSFDQIGMRLGIHAMQAQRIMRRMAGQGFLKLMTKGTRREPGVKAVAGIYKWLLPLPQPANNSTQSIP